MVGNTGPFKVVSSSSLCLSAALGRLQEVML